MRKDLSIKELLIMGGGLFAMHFGAACMLFPVQWGKDAGTALWPVFIGVLLSGVILPYLGYVALVKGNGTFLDICRKISPRFGTFFTALTIFVMGPLYMVPRMSAAAWAAIQQFTGMEIDGVIPVIIFSIVYYSITYWFVSNPGKVVDKVGNILFPILVVVVIAVIVKSLVTPISTTWAAPSFDQNPVIFGFLQGYATADLQCAVVFGVIVVQGIRTAGIGEKYINRNLIKIGAVGLGLLLLTILGHMIAGANTGGTIDLTLSALYTEMVLQLWGETGGLLFNIALCAAALTTAIGAVSSTSEIWADILVDKGPKFSYKNICIAACVLSAFIALMDLDTIVAIVGPVLDACYPAGIVVAVYYCFSRKNSSPGNLKAAKWSMIAAFAMSILELLSRYNEMFNWGQGWIDTAFHAMPLSAYSLAWLPVSAVVYLAVKLTNREN
ncbi:MAG: branched-chain amino acid transport system II carrier protein [Clostridiales bacterium]|nr:branched-chain amino acid transport system II carrier protein [Candidatus Crickella caballi]